MNNQKNTQKNIISEESVEIIVDVTNDGEIVLEKAATDNEDGWSLLLPPKEAKDLAESILIALDEDPNNF